MKPKNKDDLFFAKKKQICLIFSFDRLVNLISKKFNSCFRLDIRKKFEKSSDGNRTEFDEYYGFIIENDSQLTDICQNGYQCIETNFNVLGKYRMIAMRYIFLSLTVLIRKPNTFHIHWLSELLIMGKKRNPIQSLLEAY